MKRNKKFDLFICCVWLSAILSAGCKKLVEIKPPTYSIQTQQIFADSPDALAALDGIYTKIINQGGDLNIGSGGLTIYPGSSADELLPFQSQGDQWSTNTLLSNGPSGRFWGDGYPLIYAVNAILEGLNNSATLSQQAKNEFSGQAKFMRAFLYFYLINCYDDVPYLTSSDFRVNAQAARTPKQLIYDSILLDLKSAQSLLRTDYSFSDGERIRPNALAATALLSKVLLYNGHWQEAMDAATALIDNTAFFSLNPDLNAVFLANNQEAILQWKLNTKFQPFNATPEGYNLVVPDRTYYPFYYLTMQLLGSFENGDHRFINWKDSTIFNGVVYYYPYKYKIGPSQASPGSEPTEYYMVLRLAEQFLIRAEARMQLGDLEGAKSDINAIRVRAGLSNTPAGTKEEIFSAIMHERQTELFAEWGHRWFDLKRTGTIDAVLGAEKPGWKSYQQVYPIPFSQKKLNPNLTQNPGYVN
jgi:hypothetical protein